MPAFRRKPIILEANRLKETTSVETPQGVMEVPAGMWVLKTDDGLMLCGDKDFRVNFEPVGKEGVKMLTARGPDDDPDCEWILKFPSVAEAAQQ